MTAMTTATVVHLDFEPLVDLSNHVGNAILQHPALSPLAHYMENNHVVLNDCSGFIIQGKTMDEPIHDNQYFASASGYALSSWSFPHRAVENKDASVLNKALCYLVQGMLNTVSLVRPPFLGNISLRLEKDEKNNVHHYTMSLTMYDVDNECTPEVAQEFRNYAKDLALGETNAVR